MNQISRSIAWAALLAVVACAPGEPPAESTATYFSGMTLVPGDGTAPIEGAAMIVDGGSIVAVGTAPDLEAPEGATTVDLSGRTVMPAIHSLHVHAGYLRDDTMAAEHYTRESILEDLETHAYYGVGAVLVLGSDAGDVAFQIRADQRQGLAAGARLFTAGRGITAKGGWPTIIPAIADAPRQVETEEEAREAVRALAARNVDAVKLWVDDAGGRVPKLAPELSAAAIDEAKQNDLLTMAHVFYLEDAKRLVEEGIDGLAHSVRDQEVDDELIAAMKENDVFYVPTLVAHQASIAYAEQEAWIGEAAMGETVEAAILERLTSEEFVKSQREDPGLAAAREQYGIALANVKRLADAGVRIGVGTDSGTTHRFPGYFEHREMELLVEAGLSTSDAIAAATSIPAEILGTNGGVLVQGRRADFLVLLGNPLDDIVETRNIDRVFLDGEELDREASRMRLLGGS